MKTEEQVLAQIKAWADQWDNVRAVVLTSSRADPHRTTDDLSDYDLDVHVRDVESVMADDSWLDAFGSIIVRWPLRPQPTFDEEWVTQLALFEDGVRIDFQFTESRHDEVIGTDTTYRFLVDKDGMSGRSLVPSIQSIATGPPTREAFDARLNAFWWDIQYVAKALHRGELNYAKFVLDADIRFEKALPLMRWYAGMQHDWSVDVGVYGRWVHKYVDPKTWERYLKTFSGADVDDNWRALFATIELVRDLGTRIANNLEFEYPHEVDTAVTAYLRRIAELDSESSAEDPR
jgi:aminoglycoside 6-adenylyltransferase